MQYRYRGVVHPRRHNITIKEIRLHAEHSDGAVVSIEFSVIESVIIADIKIDAATHESDYSGHGSIAYMVERSVQRILDCANYVYGVSYVAEIDQMYTDEGRKNLSPVIPVIAERCPDANSQFEFIKVASQGHQPVSWYVQKVLSDLSLSMQYPVETGFFCYRAVETMCKYFCESMTSSVKPKHINEMLEAVGGSRSDFEILKKYADTIRHGATVDISSKIRAEIFTAAWNLADGFFEFASRSYDGIVSSSERDLAKKNKTK